MQSTASDELRAVPLTYEQLGLLDHDKRFLGKDRRPAAVDHSSPPYWTPRLDCLQRSFEPLVVRHSALPIRLCKAGVLMHR